MRQPPWNKEGGNGEGDGEGEDAESEVIKQVWKKSTSDHPDWKWIMMKASYDMLCRDS